MDYIVKLQSESSGLFNFIERLDLRVGVREGERVEASDLIEVNHSCLNSWIITTHTHSEAWSIYKSIVYY